AGMIAASWFVDPAWATAKATVLLGAVLPEGQETIEAIVEDAIAQRGRTGVLALAVLLVTGRRVLGAVTKALNLVSDVDERDDPLERRAAVEVSLITGLIGALLLAFASRPLLELLWGMIGILPGRDGALLPVAHQLVRAGLLVVVFTLVYVVVPRGERFWRAAFAGAVVATALFLGARGVFVVLFLFDVLWPNLTLIYGPLAVAALLLSWGWYIALIILAGGALASHVKVMILEGRPAEEAGDAHVR
ncbi:MAG TPA: YhjD/YihY/BrkB family envelope integrity protein, partial [Thermomicrobiales bacterium]|nr:YhjD/YihY/BrkB family envelope integrity protein [Thermomicrobiales bacterium]